MDYIFSFIVLVLLSGFVVFLFTKRNKTNQFHIDYILLHIILLTLITVLYILIQQIGYMNFLFDLINFLHVFSLVAFLLHVDSAIRGYRVRLSAVYFIPLGMYLVVSILNYFDLYILSFQTGKINFLTLRIEDASFFSDRVFVKGIIFTLIILLIVFNTLKSIGSSYTIKKKVLYKIWIFSYCFVLMVTLIVTNTYYFGFSDAYYDDTINLLIRFNAILSLVFFFINPNILFYIPVINQVAIFNRVKKENYFKLINTVMEQEMLYLKSRLTIEQLAIIIGVSVKNIRASILVEKNQSFNDYINYLRVKKAEKFIREDYLGGYTVNALGIKSGFNSHQSFYRAFKKIHNTTPSLYAQKRKKMQEDHKRRKG